MDVSALIQSGISLRTRNTFGIEAKAHAWLSVDRPDLLPALRSSGLAAGLPRLVLGGGSNILLTGDFPGLVLQMANRGIEIVAEDGEATYVRAAAGENWHAFVLWTLEHGLAGLENLSLIPGSVGAAPIQNIGAYGVELKDRFHALRAFDFDSGEFIELDREACRFAYRDSVFKHALRERAAIVDVTFRLPKRWQAELHYADVGQELSARGIAQPGPRDVSEAVIAIRNRKLPDPAVIGNAGSFFKNPVVSAERRDALLAQHPQLVSYAQPDGSFKLAAGWLIDRCGWKGRSMGQAGVHDRQALVLVNRGKATGREMLQLADAIRQDVQTRFGVLLEPEPVVI
jgi:UDP-N-acetylmuramate dehydrogenase